MILGGAAEAVPGDRRTDRRADSRRPSGLRAEHLDVALGIGDREPRLSWLLPDGTSGQTAYRVCTDDGRDTEWIGGTDSVLVPWPFQPLTSGQRVTWRVQVRTECGDSDWSDSADLETGLLDAADWTVSWIRPAEDEVAAAGHRPAYELHGTFRLEEGPTRARLYATAHGLYELFVNGRRAGDIELAPGYTEYGSRLQVQAYDVTGLLVPGDNQLTAVLSDGWFRGQVGVLRATEQWGARTAFLAQVHAHLADGSVVVAGTDGGWRSRRSQVIGADLIEGQSEDRTLPPAPWSAAVPADLGFETLVWSPAPPVRRIEELQPVAVTRVSPRRQVVDLGQNINGWVRLTGLGQAGSTVTLTHGEALGPDGDVTMDHLAPAMPFLPHPLSAGQVDRVVSGGRPGEVFEPRHTSHGFRYVRVEGDVPPVAVTGVVVHTDLRRRGWFSCSDEKVNRLHEAGVWSFRGNACDIPTDCPTRERHGWTADWQVFVPTAAFLYDVAGFSTKWLRDVAVGQWDTGVIANMAPAPRAEGRDSPIGSWNGSAGWGDAAVIVPWETYRATGDIRLLDEQWPSMVAWLDFVERTAGGGRHPDRVARSAEPAVHERYLWDSGFHFGEWLVPDEDLSDMPAYLARDKGDVATAYFAYSATLMGRIASVLDRPEEAARYEALARRVRSAWRAEFVAEDGSVRPDTQANLVRALAFDLVPDELREATAARLVELIRDAGMHLATGFLATPYLLPVLADHGHADIAYELLRQDSPPSWMTMLDRGATTMWERWEGVDADGTPHESLNHYSKGAVIGFLHRYTAGIRLGDDPAYRSFRIEPVPGGGLTSASAAHESPYGRIESSWTITDGLLTLDIRVPPGTSAEAVLPGHAPRRIGPGRHTLCSPAPVPLHGAPMTTSNSAHRSSTSDR